MAIKVISVETNSFANRAGIKENDLIIKINNTHVENFLDLNYFGAEEKLTFEILRDKKSVILTKHKCSEESLGIGIQDHQCRECVNNCIFCFIDQMPPGMRNSLYVKDDDYAYSFIFGNYITLTNLGPQVINKIIAMKISPLYISVHTTNNELRRSMMRYKQDFDVLKVLEKLKSGGIAYHTQLVLVPGYNDGEELEKSLIDLTSPKLNTLGIGIVPVGLTKYRDKLTSLPSFNQKQAQEIIKIVDKFKRDFSQIYASDEFYIKADYPIPPTEYYHSFDEIENGIGMVRMLLDTWEMVQDDFADFIKTKVKQDVVFVTGVSAQKYIKQIVDELNETIYPFRAEVQVIKNKMMGESVTVCGLLSFTDIQQQIKLQEKQIPIFSKDIFNSDGLTLDNYDSNIIKKELQKEIIIVSPFFEEWELK